MEEDMVAHHNHRAGTVLDIHPREHMVNHRRGMGSSQFSRDRVDMGSLRLSRDRADMGSLRLSRDRADMVDPRKVAREVILKEDTEQRSNHPDTRLVMGLSIHPLVFNTSFCRPLCLSLFS
jgi:hypothetical protein